MSRDLNKLSKEIYENNKAKGFHEEKHSLEHMMCLVISELMEAVEAYRRNSKVDYSYEEDGLAYTIMEDNEFKDWYECTTKGSVEDELADAVIRLLDTAGALGVSSEINRSEASGVLNYITKWGFNIQSFTESIYSIIRVFILSTFSVGYRIANMIANIEFLCEVMDVDLWQHVELKNKYNNLRPYKHGNKY